jgi:hypothetical protein
LNALRSKGFGMMQQGRAAFVGNLKAESTRPARRAGRQALPEEYSYYE